MIIKKILRKLISGMWFPLYHSWFAGEKVNPSLILLESRGGLSLEGNILHILKELQKSPYQSFQKVLAVKQDATEKVSQKLTHYGIKDVKLVRFASASYYRYLSTAGYLVNDTTFPGRFVKKDGQIYLNTWHGTPLKKMGRDNVDEISTMGNVQRNLIQADYLLFPNRYMQEKMTQAYMLSDTAKGTMLLEGYPRNSVFFDAKKAAQTREELQFGNRQVIVYMPTFRGKFSEIDVEKQVSDIKSLLNEIDAKLSGEQLFLVHLHPFLQDEITLDTYRHMQSVPKAYDTYEVLNAADVLVTDYSSVFYDFANTDKKIVLFTYDEAAYAADRGVYEDIEEYPFAKADTVEELIKELLNTEQVSREAFRKKYDTYENPEAAERICRHVFRKENICREQKFVGNGKRNILIYGGDLNQNGITTALLSMLEGVDRQKYNYFLAFRKSILEKYPERIKKIPDWCQIIPIATELETDALTLVAHKLYFRFGWHRKWIVKRMDRQYAREWRKHFGDIDFQSVIHYNGYERYIIALFQRYTGKRTIWVHNDMEQEIKNRGNQNYFQLRDAYRSYDHVVVVSEDIKEATLRISGREDNLLVIGNCHRYRDVVIKAGLPLEFQKNTECNIAKDQLNRILRGSDRKFISIGRFSVEKGHHRLINAFSTYWKTHTNTYLIIIGGAGELYEQTLQWAKESPAGDHIILIRAMENPMAVLSRCQLFLLSSFYEGLGLVLLEADTLQIPVVSCDITGPRGFMKEHGGTLVENSEAGLLHAMEMFDAGQIPCMQVDYEKMNQTNIEKFEAMVDSDA